MFNRSNNDPHQQNAEALQRHDADLVRHGQMGAVSMAKCVLAPATDFVRVRRLGPEKMPTTYIGVMVTQSGSQSGVALRPSDARRMAMALLDAADEADGTARLEFTVRTSTDDGEGE